ncbi:MAG TPA: hypothetical protein PKV71_15085 [Calditrichia bacterium]|nr:hypothetical protein [Calditrichia bacterium]
MAKFFQHLSLKIFQTLLFCLVGLFGATVLLGTPARGQIFYANLWEKHSQKQRFVPGTSQEDFFRKQKALYDIGFVLADFEVDNFPDKSGADRIGFAGVFHSGDEKRTLKVGPYDKILKEIRDREGDINLVDVEVYKTSEGLKLAYLEDAASPQRYNFVTVHDGWDDEDLDPQPKDPKKNPQNLLRKEIEKRKKDGYAPVDIEAFVLTVDGRKRTQYLVVWQEDGGRFEIWNRIVSGGFDYINKQQANQDLYLADFEPYFLHNYKGRHPRVLFLGIWRPGNKGKDLRLEDRLPVFRSKFEERDLNNMRLMDLEIYSPRE